MPFSIELLAKYHNRKQFSCGVEALDKYLREEAGQYKKKYLAATYVLVDKGAKVIQGYYTLSATSVNVALLPESLRKKMPRFPTLPATLLGRLAVDLNYQGKALGELLLTDALKRSLLHSDQIGALAVIVDAKDNNVVDFYMKYGFLKLVDNDRKLFLSMATIKSLF